MHRVRLLALLLLAAPLGAAAVDAPHEAGTNCSNCHVGHNAPGGSLTTELGNFSLCQSCHLAEAGFGFPWAAGDQAVPGASGKSHRWDAPATNMGATAPAPGTPMGQRLEAGNLQCSTCHDQHQSDVFAAAERGGQHVSPVAKVVGTGDGTMAVGTPPVGATAKPYVVQFTTGGAVGTARFRVSNDNKISWAQSDVLTAATVTLADGVPLDFTGAVPASFAVNDEFKFYVSYPYLRVSNLDGQMCTTCHKDRNQTWQNADGTGPIVGTGEAVVFGTTRFSHPVNQALNQGGRTNGLPGGILDANGMVQASSTDPNRTNDLVLGTGGIVTCLTCHHPHNADSNSLSEDPR